MSHPNISVRSNVFVRRHQNIADDVEFLSQVRGRTALLLLLRRLAPTQQPKDAARTFLNRRQLGEVAWQARCALCGAFPEGSVTCRGSTEVQFRCPAATCTPLNRVARIVLINVGLLMQCAEKFRRPLPAIVQEALQHQNAPSARAEPSEGNRRPVTVLLTLSQYHFLSDADIEAALKAYVEHGK
jgi:hypothetical protein